MKLTLVSLSALLAAPLAFASIIPIGALDGTGLGNVNPLLTIRHGPTESGCMSVGAGGTRQLGAASCPGNGPNGGTNFTGGNEKTGASESAVYSVAGLGLTNFNNLRLILNGNEPLTGSGPVLKLTNLAISLWNPTTGSLIDVLYLGAPPYNIANINPGIGKIGYGFQLDAAGAANANSLLAAFPNMYIAASMNIGRAGAGPETLSIASVIPEPSTYALFGSGALLLGLCRRRMRN